MLSQKDDQGRECLIAFASRLLRSNETTWDTTELEAFAAVWALETFRAYFEGSPTLVRPDHSPFPWIRNNRGTKTKIARWIPTLQYYAFDFKHRAGLTHSVLDALSRYPTRNPGDEHEFTPSETKERWQQLKDALSLFDCAPVREATDVAQKLAVAQTAQCSP